MSTAVGKLQLYYWFVQSKAITSKVVHPSIAPLVNGRLHGDCIKRRILSNGFLLGRLLLIVSLGGMGKATAIAIRANKFIVVASKPCEFILQWSETHVTDDSWNNVTGDDCLNNVTGDDYLNNDPLLHEPQNYSQLKVLPSAPPEKSPAAPANRHCQSRHVSHPSKANQCSHYPWFYLVVAVSCLLKRLMYHINLILLSCKEQQLTTKWPISVIFSSLLNHFRAQNTTYSLR